SERQTMPHVEQRLLVHRLVLEDREGGLPAVEQWIPRPIELGMAKRVDDLSIGFVRERLHLTPRRPRRTHPGGTGGRALVRIDAARKERLEPSIEAGTSERLLDQRVEAERRQVPFVEHDRMAERDRLAVVRVLGQQIEERSGPRTVAAVPIRQLCCLDE